jgi:hypothetical protein
MLLLARCAKACADMRILWDLPLLQQVSSAALEERAQDRLQAQGRVDFALFNIPGIAKSLMPVDNEPKHGGVAEPIRRFERDTTSRRGKERIDQLRLCV